MKTSCITKIQGSKKMMSGAELRVAQFILDNREQTLNLTVTELAEKAGVSDATVVRFCRTMGYKGYQDFKINLASDMAQPNVPVVPGEFSQTDSVSDLICKVIRSEMGALEETIATLDAKQMEDIASLILHARRVVFFGTGGSLMVAMDAMHKFLKIGIKATVQMDSDIQKMESSLMEKGDVAIAISHSGSSSHVLECVRNAQEGGAKVIGITTIGKSPLQKVCDYLLMSPTKEFVFRSESVSARIAQLSILDCLVAIMSYMDYDSSKEAIRKTRQATSGTKA